MEDHIIYTGAANYFRGIEAVGGKLTLYSNRLYFKSHGFAIQAEPQTIFLTDIMLVGARNTMGLIPNGMVVITQNLEEHKFVLYKRKIWIEKIQAALKSTS